MSRAYAEPNAADRLKVYETFVIDRVLQYRKIKFTKDTPVLEKLLDIELHDTGMLDDPKKQRKRGANIQDNHFLQELMQTISF